MIYFKDDSGEIYAYEEHQLEFVKAGLTPLTEGEYNDLRNSH